MMNLRFILISLSVVCFSNFAIAEDESPFDQESKGVARPVISVDSADIEALSKALKSNSEDLIVDRASKILAKDPDHLKALNALAVYYFKTKKYGMAKIIINRALAKNPKEPALHNNLAIIYLAEGDMRSAIQSFRQSLASGPYRLGTVNLSSILLENYDFKKAVGPLEDAYSEVRSDLGRGQSTAVDLANNYAVALMGSGDGSKAKRVFQTILESGSRDPEVYLNYAILQVDIMNDKKDGQKTLSKLQFMTDDAKILRQAQELESRAK